MSRADPISSQIRRRISAGEATICTKNKHPKLNSHEATGRIMRYINIVWPYRLVAYYGT